MDRSEGSGRRLDAAVDQSTTVSVEVSDALGAWKWLEAVMKLSILGVFAAIVLVGSRFGLFVLSGDGRPSCDVDAGVTYGSGESCSKLPGNSTTSRLPVTKLAGGCCLDFHEAETVASRGP